MNDIIQLLPDSVANQIAAGEVIQRPSSIIKELVENSLDAGASRIQIIVADAGKTYVQVIDDGKGMSETDARLSFERHATSKIREAADLFALTTMGFRGEALASIAAVAQVELKTRREEDELGIQINIEGSRITGQENVMCPVGANFLVKNIFFNTPVRRRYLGSDRTELKNIMTEFERIALAHPEISLSIATPDSKLLDLPPSSFRQRIVNVFGKNIDRYLLNVQVETSAVRIVGFVGSPESSKKKGAQQFLFVNGRYMKNVVFAKAVMNAYERLIPEGEQVPFFLQLFVDPEKIDVNIHPTKTEIKFEDSHTIFQIIMAAVREALGKFNAIPTIDFDTCDRPDIPLFTGSTEVVKEPKINYDPNFNPFESTDANNKSTATAKRGKAGGTRASATVPTGAIPRPEMISLPTRGFEPLDIEMPSADSQGIAPETPPYDEVTVAPNTTSKFTFVSLDDVNRATLNGETDLFASVSATGQQTWDPANADYLQYRGRYLVTPVESGLLVIDVPRAHTRVLYEDYIKQEKTQSTESQGLLFAHILELTPAQSAILEAMTEEVESLGFNISSLGGGTFSILGVPSGIEGMDPVRLLKDIVDDASENTPDTKEQILHTVALTIARRSAIPVGQHLSLDEIRNLAQRLFQTSNPNVTPDGRVILSIIPHDNIAAKFHR